jgi:hypothetical protein
MINFIKKWHEYWLKRKAIKNWLNDYTNTYQLLVRNTVSITNNFINVNGDIYVFDKTLPHRFGYVTGGIFFFNIESLENIPCDAYIVDVCKCDINEVPREMVDAIINSKEEYDKLGRFYINIKAIDMLYMDYDNYIRLKRSLKLKNLSE